MALIGFDGFDHYNTYADLAARVGSLVWTGVSNALSFSTGRNGFGKCLLFQAGASIVGAFSSGSPSTGFFGFGVYFPSQPSGGNFEIAFLDTGSLQFKLHVDLLLGSMSLLNASGQIATTGPAGVAQNTWVFLEIGYVIAGSLAGSVTVKINSAVVGALTGSSFTTQSTANASANGISFSASAGQPGIDDFYCIDTTAPAGNVYATFLGDVTVETLFPVSNVSAAFTPLAGTNYQEVSETAFDGDTTYNSSSSAGATDLFRAGSLRSNAVTVKAVQVTGGYRKDDGGTRTMQQLVVSNGTTANIGASFNLASSYNYQTGLLTVDPSTSANWTVSGVNSLEIGYNLVA